MTSLWRVVTSLWRVVTSLWRLLLADVKGIDDSQCIIVPYTYILASHYRASKAALIDGNIFFFNEKKKLQPIRC